MSARNRARNEVADRRFATASRVGAKAAQTSNFGTETPYLALGNVSRAECRSAGVTVCDIALRTGAGTEGADEVLDILGLKDFAR